ncbi:hypothetical protein ACFLVU_05910 [Chloroflexota bacterium]
MAGKAESRLLYNSISMSERVGMLGVKGALIYTWIITHCDTQGRMQGKPAIIKQQVVPFIEEITVEDIGDILHMMKEHKLVLLYNDSKGRLLLQIADWWEYQTGLKYKSPSHYEAPPRWQDKLTPRSEDGKFTKEAEEGKPF